jgi:hypothetical protein
MICYLTDDEAYLEIINAYWLPSRHSLPGKKKFTPEHSLSDLGKKFRLPTNSISRIVSTNSFVTSKDCYCTQCGTPHRFTSRSVLATQRATSKKSQCERCVTESEALHLSKIEAALHAHFNRVSKLTPDADQISLKDLALLDAAICCWGAEDNPNHLVTTPVLAEDVPFSPCSSSDNAFIRQLAERNLIVLTPDVKLNPNVCLFGGDLRYPSMGTHYTVLINYHDILSRLYPDDRLPIILEIHDDEEFWKFCQSLILAECFNFLEYQLLQHNYDSLPVEKTKYALRECLKHYCTAQVFSLIFRTVKNAKNYQQKAGISRRHASNSIPGNLQRLLSWSLEKNTDVRQFDRLHHKAPSAVSVTVFDHLLKIHDGGFRYTLAELKECQKRTMIDAVRESLQS